MVGARHGVPLRGFFHSLVGPNGVRPGLTQRLTGYGLPGQYFRPKLFRSKEET
jgi:hypothetical protein